MSKKIFEKLKNLKTNLKKKNIKYLQNIDKPINKILKILKKYKINIKQNKRHEAITYFKKIIKKKYINKLLAFLKNKDKLIISEYRKIEKLLKTMLIYLQIYFRLYDKSSEYRRYIKKDFNKLLDLYKKNKPKSDIINPIKSESETVIKSPSKKHIEPPNPIIPTHEQKYTPILIPHQVIPYEQPNSIIHKHVSKQSPILIPQQQSLKSSQRSYQLQAPTIPKTPPRIHQSMLPQQQSILPHQQSLKSLPRPEEIKQISVLPKHKPLDKTKSHQLLEQKLSVSSGRDFKQFHIRNSGNTCWLSAFIQLIWRMTKFRNLILNEINDESLIDIANVMFESKLENDRIAFNKTNKKNFDKNQYIDFFKLDDSIVIFRFWYNFIREINRYNEIIINLSDENLYNIHNMINFPIGEQLDPDEAFKKLMNFSCLNYIFPNKTDNIIIDTLKSLSTVKNIITKFSQPTNKDDIPKTEWFNYINLAVNVPIVESDAKTYNPSISELYNLLHESRSINPNRFEITEYFLHDDISNIVFLIKRTHMDFSLKNKDTGIDKVITKASAKTMIRVDPELEIDNMKFKIKGSIIHLGDSNGSGHYVFIDYDDLGNPLYLYNDTFTDIRLYMDEYQKDQKYNHELGMLYLYERIDLDT